MKTLNKLVLVKVIEQEKITTAGLVIPIESKNNPYKRGRVMVVAADCIQPIKVGDEVLYYRKGVQSADLPLDGEVFDLVTENGIALQLEGAKVKF